MTELQDTHIALRRELDELREQVADLRGQTIEMAFLLHKAVEWHHAEDDIQRQLAEQALREALDEAGL